MGTLRVAMLTDAHVGTTFDGTGLAAHIARVQEQQPDVAVIVGDFVVEDTIYEDIVSACQTLRQLDTPYGAYFALGNHDKGNYCGDIRGTI